MSYASAGVDASWVVPGAEVLVYYRGPDALPRHATVATVATKSFTIDGFDGRFDLATLSQQRKSGSQYRLNTLHVVAVDSAQGQRLLAAARVDSLRSAAHAAVDRWNTGEGRGDKAKTEAVLDAFYRYLEVL